MGTSAPIRDRGLWKGKRKVMHWVLFSVGGKCEPWVIAPFLCHQQYILLLLFWPPVHAVCLNNELVVLQPQTGIATELNSVSIIRTFILSSSFPTCFNLSPWIFPCFPPSY